MRLSARIHKGITQVAYGSVLYYQVMRLYCLYATVAVNSNSRKVVRVRSAVAVTWFGLVLARPFLNKLICLQAMVFIFCEVEKIIMIRRLLLSQRNSLGW